MSHPNEEKTLVLIKPDGVKRGLVGEIIRRIEQRGLKIIALKMILASREHIDEHYPKNPEWIRRLGGKTMATYEKYSIDAKEVLGTDDPEQIGKMVRGWIVDFMVSGPIIKMAIEGIHAVDMVRKLCGHTLPNMAEMGTIRGDYSVDSPALANAGKRAVHNLIHASETPEEAAHELAFWFGADDLHGYKRAEEDIMF
ncbi:MAG: nucleoside-diphosphate kinase [Patescibacteria group bacterium]